MGSVYLMQVEQIVKEASKLSEGQRASIASQLLNTLESPHYSVSDEEVARRVAEADSDSSVMIGFDKFVNGVRRSGS